MYFKINPSVGPANGGTSVNVTGKNIGYPNEKNCSDHKWCKM